eukprot:scaffold178861_cov20-Tisochrysis_lutea.AAC.1
MAEMRGFIEMRMKAQHLKDAGKVYVQLFTMDGLGSGLSCPKGQDRQKISEALRASKNSPEARSVTLSTCCNLQHCKLYAHTHARTRSHTHTQSQSHNHTHKHTHTHTYTDTKGLRVEELEFCTEPDPSSSQAWVPLRIVSPAQQTSAKLPTVIFLHPTGSSMDSEQARQ